MLNFLRILQMLDEKNRHLLVITNELNSLQKEFWYFVTEPLLNSLNASIMTWNCLCIIHQIWIVAWIHPFQIKWVCVLLVWSCFIHWLKKSFEKAKKCMWNFSQMDLLKASKPPNWEECQSVLEEVQILPWDTSQRVNRINKLLNQVERGDKSERELDENEEGGASL